MANISEDNKAMPTDQSSGESSNEITTKRRRGGKRQELTDEEKEARKLKMRKYSKNYMRKYYGNHKDIVLQSNAKYRNEHREELNEKHRKKWREDSEFRKSRLEQQKEIHKRKRDAKKSK